MALAACLLMLSAAPLAARADDWEQVAPSQPQAHSATGIDNSVLSGIAGSLRGRKDMGCAFAGRFAADTAKLRDKGAGEQSQLKRIDDPHGTFRKLAATVRLPGDTTAALSATLHRAVIYVYDHPEMTPAQLKSHWEQACRNPGGGQ